MICSRCITRMGRARTVPHAPSTFILPTYLPPRRHQSNTTSTPTPTPTLTLASVAEPAKDAKDAKETKILSSIPAGTPLKGINYLKKLTDPIALADSEYPPWLWTVNISHKPSLSAESMDTDVDLYSKSKVKRKAAQKRMRNKVEGGGVKVAEVPKDWRTRDMEWKDVEGAMGEREEAKKVARARRRAGIKERNFLGGLR